MSSVSANTLRAKDLATETPMIYPVRGSAKAWANLNGTGTIAMRDSLNIASTVDNATGDYTFNLTAAMSNANYSMTGSSSDLTTVPVNLIGMRPSAIATGSTRAKSCYSGDSSNITSTYDASMMAIQNFGALA